MRCRLPLVALWLVVATTVAAQTPGEGVPVEGAPVQEAPVEVTPAAEAPCDRTSLEELDVVDLHAHAFNLRYVPLKAILYRFGLPWPVAGRLARILHDATGVIDPDAAPPDAAAPRPEVEMSAEAPEASLQRLLAAADEDALADLERFRPEISRALAKHRLEEEKSLDPGLAASADRRRQTMRSFRQAYAEQTGFDLLAELLYRIFLRGDEAEPEMLLAPEAALVGRLSGVRDTLRVLMLDERSIVRRMQADFPEVDLFVHHMMDLAHVYDERAPLGFEEQVRHAAVLDREFGERLDFFVAFDPFRGSLEALDEGLAAGAVGVKFYPPSGYRPTETFIPPKPKWLLPLTASCKRRSQHRARYSGVEPDELDALNMRFFRRAADRNLIVFSHQNRHGFQAGHDYGKDMGAPCYWQRVFRRIRREDPDAALPTVVLAHAGGPGPWFGKGEWEGSFAQQAYNLCVLYDNVYCDFGYPALVLKKERRQALAERLEALFSREPDPARPVPDDLCAYEENAPPRLHLGTKIVYGSDWLVAVASRRNEFACRFDEVFGKEPLRKYRAAFFGANARRILSGNSPPAPGSPP